MAFERKLNFNSGLGLRMYRELPHLTSLSSFSLCGILEAHIYDMGSRVPCNENIDLCIFALNLADVGLSCSYRFYSSLFFMANMQVTLNLAVKMRSGLGLPPWED